MAIDTSQDPGQFLGYDANGRPIFAPKAPTAPTSQVPPAPGPAGPSGVTPIPGGRTGGPGPGAGGGGSGAGRPQGAGTAGVAGPDDPLSSLDIDIDLDLPEEQAGPIKRFLGGIVNSMNPIPLMKDLFAEGMKDLWTPGMAATRMSTKLAVRMGAAQVGEMTTAQRLYKEAMLQPEGSMGRNAGIMRAAGHAAAALTPLVGPPAAAAAEKIVSGDVAGGLGEAVGLLATSVSPSSAVGAVHKGAAAIPKVANAMDRVANTGMAKVMAPTTGKDKVMFGRMAKKDAPALLRDPDLGATSRAQLHEKVTIKAEEAVTELNRAYEEIPATPANSIPLAPIRAAIKAEIARLQPKAQYEGVVDLPAGKTGEKAPFAKEMEVTITPAMRTERIKALNTALAEITHQGDRMNPVDARNLAMAWGDGAKKVYTPQTAADYLALRGEGHGWAAAEQALRDAVVSVHPSLKPANTRYHLYRSAQSVMDAAEEARTVQPATGRRTVEAIAGGIAGGAYGGVPGAIAGVVLLPIIDAAATSGVTSQVGVSRALARMADALRRNKGALAEFELSRISKTLGMNVTKEMKEAVRAAAARIRRSDNEAGSVPGPGKTNITYVSPDDAINTGREKTRPKSVQIQVGEGVTEFGPDLHFKAADGREVSGILSDASIRDVKSAVEALEGNGYKVSVVGSQLTDTFSGGLVEGLSGSGKKATAADQLTAKSGKTTGKFGVEIDFAVSPTRVVGTFDDMNAAMKRAREYMGADARGIRIIKPDGSKVELPKR